MIKDNTESVERKDGERCEILMFYKIGENESVQSVARKFSISPQNLVFHNAGIKIQDGVTIVIPKLFGRSYKVQACDTIGGICDKFGINVDEFVKKNGVEFVYHGMIVWV